MAKQPSHMIRLATETYVMYRKAGRVYAGYAKITMHEEVRVTGWDSSMARTEMVLENAVRLARRKTRKCLSCGEDFRSEGPHNRLCDLCRTASVVEDYKLEL